MDMFLRNYVDLFPRTSKAADIQTDVSSHVETVVLLNNKFSKAKDFVQIDVNAEDYYRIKDSEKESEKTE